MRPEPDPDDCEYTNFPVCPWCGNHHHDVGDFGQQATEYDCEECGKPYWCSPELVMTFTTRKIEE